MKPNSSKRWPKVLATVGLLMAPLAQAKTLMLEEAITLAQTSDVWIENSRYNEAAQYALGDAAGRLPDPKFNLALANMPTDTFDFGQEGMTQLVMGVSQMIPRGNTLSLKEARFAQQAELQPLMRAERRARVRLQVSQLWLDAWQAQQSLALINDNRVLFEQLVDVATSSYVSAMGRTRQQDLVRAQLELTQLDDRLARLQLQRDSNLSRLSEWLTAGDVARQRLMQPDLLQLSADLPAQTPPVGPGEGDDERARVFIHHPSVLLIDRQIDLARTDVELVEQKYEPEWGISASYGYRSEDPMGRDRADLVTVGISLDMPLFSTRRQDSEVAAAGSRVEAVKTERLLQLRKMLAGYDTARAAYERVSQRLSLYETRLIPQSHEAAEAALNAYTSDDGNFAEVVRARIAELNAELAVIELKAEQQRQVAQINYLLTRAETGEK
ncbi:TolC family protein [Marinobacterium sp. AK62]|uniref:TolC family protein n=1 Tax=Marinobacterium alkalitolerans TaxID=1542925 RepID=A0ABS3ZA44_9GAMM|nr:TolC family protein [Marinobacterium alkalitolerans]MBP0048578.1 TolC family protein [Marinobacterium alkalitolerans]